MSQILRDILDSTKLEPSFCAELVGVSEEQFRGWFSGSSPIPRFALPELASILGVSEKLLVAGTDSARRSDSTTLAPAVWYKLRDTKVHERDREVVGLVRKLGYYIDQLQTIRSIRARQFEIVFQTIRERVDRKQPPALQGIQAAQLFRSVTELTQGQMGIGEWVRPTLRRLGVLVVESPVNNSSVEGFAFLVGTEQVQTPCVFANSRYSTWFRRNAVILHEIAHAIFDLNNDPVTIDFRDENRSDLSEIRADEFARECLVPRSVMVQVQNRLGLRWDELDESGLAQLVAHTHAEQKLVLKSALNHELITDEQFQRYLQYDCGALIREFSTHALPTRDYLKTLADESPKWIAENRNIGFGRRSSLRLPSAYVAEVIDAFRENEISLGKAAEMLLMDRSTFQTRFVAASQEQPVV